MGVYSEPSQTSKIKNIAKIVNGFKPLTNIPIDSNLDVCVGSEYVTAVILYHTKC